MLFEKIRTRHSIGCCRGDFSGLNNLCYSYFPFGKLPACDFCDQCIISYVDNKIIPHDEKIVSKKLALTITR